jgi:hypothetical protein
VSSTTATDCRVTVPVAFCVSSSCSLGTTVEVSDFFSYCEAPFAALVEAAVGSVAVTVPPTVEPSGAL